MVDIGFSAVGVLEVFVKDVEAAHGEGAPQLLADWPDLHATYLQAKAVVTELALWESSARAQVAKRRAMGLPVNDEWEAI